LLKTETSASCNAGEKPQDVEQFYPETKPKTGQAAVRPFKCSVCGKNSRWKWDVTKHIKMVHRGEHLSSEGIFPQPLIGGSVRYFLAVRLKKSHMYPKLII